ncbi:MAG: aspartate ammonia-lyase [Zetaproteobacteria bacterium]|nr:MAG: aspartate ammonia-lyase [Zetaproteobacteria bacterium]
MRTRSERDALGEHAVPAEAYFGIQTLRAAENFRISGLRAHSALIVATAQIKLAAAQANVALGRLSPTVGSAIAAAAREIVGGRLHDQFVVDVFQAGAGTSHNMNANEVLANRALELLGEPRGRYAAVHPNDHVNMGQSTNDVFPTAMRLAVLARMHSLLQALDGLENALGERARLFDGVVKAGRTHLQDATPIRLGQEFGGYAAAVAAHQTAVGETRHALRAVGLGGTAVGTGANVHPDYRRLAIGALAEVTGEPLVAAADPFDAMQSMRPFAALSGALRTLCLDLVRICNDLRLLASGPRTGLAEISLPAVQPGSSIMPGKVNPVMAEMLTMVCFQAIGHDLTIALAAQAGQLELNVMMPVIAHALLQSVDILASGIAAFTSRCVTGIQADVERCRRYADETVALVTALSPRIGYERAAALAKEVLASGRSVREVAAAQGLLTPTELGEFLDPRRLTEPG